MNVDEFMDIATEPERWVERAIGLRRSADVLWEKYVDSWTTPGMFYVGIDFMFSDKLLYGLAVEVALKGRILKDKPEKVEFDTKTDGRGRLTSVSLKEFGKTGDGHNLIALARLAGCFTGENDVYLAKVLDDLSNCIRWHSRYPVPKSIEAPDPKLAKTPITQEGVSVTAIIGPLLDGLLEVDGNENESV